MESTIVQSLAMAATAIDNIEGAWIKDQKVKVKDGKIVEYGVVMKVTFVLRD